jgi:LCP family protein required for cell wall assembly
MAAPPGDLLATPQPPGRGLWVTWRVVLAAVGVILISGGATAVLALNEVGKLADALGRNHTIKIASRVLTAAGTGAPQTLLLVGNDQRPPPKSNPNGFVLPHSNEMLLVRIDPSKPTIAMMSIPRELQVPIDTPSGRVEVTRINAALAFGGIELMTKTIKQVIGIPINHVFVVTFPKFKRAVNEMGCVYMTVDRRYYHRNEPGGEQYFEINLQPGYQRVCGAQALEFVANRHEDTSLNRDARDQRFLLEVKSQYGASLFESREKFESILGKAVETDVHGTGEVLDLLRLLVESAGKPVRQVHFQVTLQPTYDTASPQQIAESVRSFLSGTAAVSTHSLRNAVHAGRAGSHSHHTSHAAVSRALGLTAPTAEAIDHARSQAPRLPFALEYPRARQSLASAGPDLLRVYAIRDPAGHIHPAYVIVVDQGLLGQFYDIQGTSWANPPLLSNPNQEVQIGRRTYGLFYAGEQLKTVAWHEGGATYWIENTLTNSLSSRVMLAVAQETVPVISVPGAPSGGGATVNTPAFKLPARAAVTAGTMEEVGAGLGLVGLAVVAFGSVLVIGRQREVRTLREQVARAISLEARQRPLLAAAGLAPATTGLAPATTEAQTPGARAPAGPFTTPSRAAPASSAAASGGGVASSELTSEPTGEPTGEPTIYRARRRSRPGVLAGMAALLAVLALAGYLVLRGGGSTNGSRPLPVSVFNATSRRGEAHRIASALHTQGVRVTHVGDINSTLGPGAFVLYPPGAREQATRVAHLLPGVSATVTPIQPQVQSAIGRAQELVVVLD